MSTVPVNGSSTLSTGTEKIRDGSTVAIAVSILPQEFFIRMLSRERRRTERSRRRFVLMLLESTNLLKSGSDAKAFEQVLYALSKSTRETDIMGWYEEGSVIGIIFTEIGDADGRAVADALLSKVPNALCSTVGIEQINKISVSFHLFPEESENHDSAGPADRVLYPDLLPARRPTKISRLAKRSLDVLASLVGMALLSPVFLVISGLIRLTSAGPAFFRQVRVGQGGKRFTFLKFRSMYSQCDPTIHRDYVKSFIAGARGAAADGGQPNMFKLTDDPRITPLGRFLRRSSLDELPQLLNVLRGEMSLVGPRPPVPYEFESYDIWHKRRLMGVKPGLTGLWQVEGRSRVGFDEMVRMDLQYVTSWSLWLDFQILLKTPRAVYSGAGAY